MKGKAGQRRGSADLDCGSGAKGRRGLAWSSRTAILAGVVACLLDAMIATRAVGQTFSEFAVPTAGSDPRRIAAGPDGNLWFMELNANKIARITPAGAVTEFAIPTANAIIGSDRPIVGPDGNLWFGESNAGKIARITPAGVITEFTLPTPPPLKLLLITDAHGSVGFAENGTPDKIGKITPQGTIYEAAVSAGANIKSAAIGSDTNVWFNEKGTNKIGRVTPLGAVTEFTIPTANSGDSDIIAGRDGNLWFDEPNVSQIGRITTAGVFTEYATPTPNSGPFGFSADASGNLYYVESAVNKVVRIDTTGPTFTEISVALNFADTNGSALGPDGNFWLADSVANQIDRVTPAGVVSSYTVPTASSGASDVVAGPDGNVWFCEQNANQIGRITTGCPTFGDVPGDNPIFPFICKIALAGITSGCGNGNYCPDSSVTRAQMAVFLLRAEHGSSYNPPMCHGVFTDVPCPGAFAVNWIEQLAAESITGGCGNGNYCPNDPVTRAQMAVFLLRAEHGSSYNPPMCHGVFTDVPCPAGFAVNWIEQLSAEGITGGCGNGNYCPNNDNTRAQMAVFLVATFHL